MKWSLFLLTTLLFSCRPHLGEGEYSSKVIYGIDDRHPMEIFTHLASSYESTLLMVPPQAIYPLPEILFGEEMILLSWGSLTTGVDSDAGAWERKQYPLCPEVSFYGQGIAGSCSGVLIAPDLVLTASHCVESSCNRNYWAFDYRAENSLEGRGITLEGSNADHSSVVMIESDKVWSCSSILSSQNLPEEDDIERLDFALIQLSGYVYDRSPIRLGSSYNQHPGKLFTLLGYPLGLTGKATTKVQILDNSAQNYMITDADSFQGNSGSPLVDSISGEMIGILVGGEKDFLVDDERQCLYSNTLAPSQATERVTRIEAILKYIEENANNGAALVEYIRGSQPASI